MRAVDDRKLDGVTMARSFGPLLRHYRQVAGFSQEQLAHRASLSSQAISLLERGLRRFPRPETIEALAKGLGLDAENAAALVDSARRPPASTVSQLPPPTPSFTGREKVLQSIVEHFSAGGVPHPSVPILAIDGMPGAGKTALAVKAAHEVVANYPDGQLLIDLHGFTAGVTPEDPATVLAQILRLLGVTGQGIPEDLAQRAALYRSTLAGKRILIVLDNAISADQIMPLLPGTTGCAVLITSRSRLVGVRAARPVSLEPLDDAEAIALFTKIAGRSDDAPLLRRIVELCGHLPLAIEIVAAHYQERLDQSLVNLVDELTMHDDSLADLRTGQSSVNAAFQVSYAQLAPDHQRLFRAMTLNPGASMDETAAAVLAGKPLPQTRRTLDDFVDAHLLMENEPGQYTFHDLLRTFAVRTSSIEDSDQERVTLTQHLHDHYAAMASRAMDLAHPYDLNRRPMPARPTAFALTLSDSRRATAWLDRELNTLLRIAETDTEFTLHLCGTLHRDLLSRGRLNEVEALYRVALETARQRTDRREEARMLHHCAQLHQVQGNADRAAELYQLTLTLSRTIGWSIGTLIAILGQGEVERIVGHYSAASVLYDAALALAQSVHDQSGKLRALIGLGDTALAMGRFDEARGHFESSVAISAEIGDHVGEVNATVGLGDVLYDQGQFESAIGRYQQAAMLAEGSGRSNERDYARRSLANAYQKVGRYSEAMQNLAESLEFSRRTGGRVIEVSTLVNIAVNLFAVGSHAESRARFEEARALAVEIADRGVEIRANRGLGQILHVEKHYTEAIASYGHALTLAHTAGERLSEARLHHDISKSELTLGRVAAAQASLQRAIEIYSDLGSPELDDAQTLMSTFNDG